MITHLHYEEWLDWVPAISLAIIFGVFAFAMLRLWKMKPTQSEQAARLPLENESTTEAKHK